MNERTKKIIEIIRNILFLIVGFIMFLNGLFTYKFLGIWYGILFILLFLINTSRFLEMFPNDKIYNKRILLCTVIIASMISILGILLAIRWKPAELFTFLLFLVSLVMLIWSWRIYKSL